ncbi:acyl-CoA dehydrogenase family protein [Chloroflexota bacterium]
MWYFLTEEEKRIQEIARQVAEEIAPSSLALEAKSRKADMANMEAIRKLQKAKLLALHVPKEYGGEGTNFVAWCLAQEEVAKKDLAIANCISHEACGTNLLLKMGTKQQTEYYLKKQAIDHDLWGICATEPQGGSDMGNIQTKATCRNGKYLLNGTKSWVLNGDVANRHIVWASTDPGKKIRGLSVFIVERDTPGVTVGRSYVKAGWTGISTTDLILENAEVPEENRIGEEGDGFKAFLASLNPGRVGIAAQALGLAEGAFEYALDYAKQRIVFGRPIADFQAINFKLADMATAIEAERALVYTTARLIDEGHPDADKLTAMAKYHVSDMAVQVTSDAVEILGGAGYVADHPVEKMMRDAPGLRIADGTNGIMRLIVTSSLLPKTPR